MTPEKLIQVLREEPKGLKELQAQKNEIEEKIGELIGNRFNDAFGQITIDELREIWKNADHTQRYLILDSNSEVEEHIEKLDSYGGLSENEIIQEIIEVDWNKSEWLPDMEEYFEPYCKEEKQ